MSDEEAETVSLHLRVLRAWVAAIFKQRALKGMDMATTTKRLQDAVILMRVDANAGVEALRLLEAETAAN